MKQFLFYIAITLLATSCAKSLTYSPSLNLPVQPLEKKEIDFQGGVELFPESRPDQNEIDNNSLGFHFMASYGISDKFNLSAKGWFDTSDEFDGGIRPGLSLTGQFIKELSPSSNLLFVPRVGMANLGDGYGISTSVVYQKTANQKLSWYSGFGLGWGFSSLNKTSYNSNQAPTYPFGYIAMANLGLGYNLTSALRLNCELNPIYQINTFDDVTHLLVAPSIGLGYTIRSHSAQDDKI